MEKETLEEAADRHIYGDKRKNFIRGAKWQQETHLDIKDNKIELLEEDLECIKMYLNDLKVPRTDKDGNEYSIVGRIKWQAERMYREEDLLSAFEAGMMFIGEYKGSFREWFEQFKKSSYEQQNIRNKIL